MDASTRSLRRGAARLSTAMIATALALLAGPALAQGSDQEREACTPDVFRLCSSQIPNVDRIVACLKSDMSKLSPACRAVMSGADRSAARARGSRS